ncbi:MAG TPA: BON domain-containing protein [Usitatibacter sp.]|nr:BON domain-containing protein [Usitatibacter sp.]
MSQITNARRRSPRLLPFAAGAVAAALALAACDRPVTRSASIAPAQEPLAQQAAPRMAERPQSGPAPAPLPPKDALSDTVITGKIKAAILTDPSMQGADVSVNTDHGVVALAGTVSTPEQTAIASAHAQRQDGVMRVDNNLGVPRQ